MCDKILATHCNTLQHTATHCNTLQRPHCSLSHSYVWHDSFVCVIGLRYVCDMSHSPAWHGAFICVSWLVHFFALTQLYMCALTHLHVSHPSFICVTWLLHVRAMTSRGHVDVGGVDVSGAFSTSLSPDWTTVREYSSWVWRPVYRCNAHPIFSFVIVWILNFKSLSYCSHRQSRDSQSYVS